jgi:hypothetical protein
MTEQKIDLLDSGVGSLEIKPKDVVVGVGEAALEKIKSVPKPFWGFLFGAGLAVASRPAEAGSGDSSVMARELAEWAPAAMMYAIAFCGGAAKSLGLTHSRWYQNQIDEVNEGVRTKERPGVEKAVMEQIREVMAANNGKIPNLPANVTSKQYADGQIATNLARIVDQKGLKPVNPWARAGLEGLRMVGGIGGLGLVVSDALIGLTPMRVAVTATYAISNFAWLIGIDEKERLWADTTGK